MPKIIITNRFTKQTIYEGEHDSLRAALEECARLGSNLSWATLSWATLYGASLSGANLSGANLSGANLYEANLYGADLSGAKLSEAKGVELVVAQTRILPAGALIGWKKAATPSGYGIVRLRIPEDAPRSHAFGRKCRCAYAEVLEAPEGAFTKANGPRTEYRAGEVVRADKWDDNWQEECSHGIHFFITREEAEAYEI